MFILGLIQRTARETSPFLRGARGEKGNIYVPPASFSLYIANSALIDRLLSRREGRQFLLRESALEG